jgi:hypothetical protein
MAHKLPLADIQFIADFAAYARGRGKVAYDFVDPGNCACCQFLRDTGRAEEPRVVPTDWRDGVLSGTRFPLPEGLNAALNAKVDGYGSTSWRFDLLADRLEALIADSPLVERAQ